MTAPPQNSMVLCLHVCHLGLPLTHTPCRLNPVSPPFARGQAESGRRVLLDAASPCPRCMALQRACACGRPAGAPAAWAGTRVVSPNPGRTPLPGAWASWGRGSSLNPSGPGVAVKLLEKRKRRHLGGHRGKLCLGLSALCPSHRGALFV